LTRQTSFVQQRFLIYLQQIERSLSSLESGLLLWLTRPWLNAVQQSAPAFWNCHTALFEFEGDPTPVAETTPVSLTDHDPTVSHNAAVAEPSLATEPPTPSAGEIDRLHEKISGPGGPPELEPTRELPAIDTDKSLLEIEEELEFFPGAIAAGEDLSTNGQEPVAFGENLWDILTYDLAILDDYQDDLPELAGPIIETEVISSELLEVPIPEESEAIADPPDTPTSDSPIADSPVLGNSANSATGTVDSASQAPTLDFEAEAEELELSAPRFNFEAEAEELDLQGTELMQSAVSEPITAEPIASEPVTAEPEALELVTPELATPELTTPELVVAESASIEEAQTDEASAAVAPVALPPTTETESFPASLISQLYPGFSLPDMVHDSIRQSGDHSSSSRNGEILQLLKQIETLHRQQGTQAEKTEAYRLLGNLYRDRIEQGEISYQNLLIAIFAYEQALTHLEDDNAPLWSDGLNDIGNLYWMLSRQFPDPEMSLSYLEQGIAAYQLALSKTNPKTRPQSYAMIQNNLGSAYGDLARYQMSAEILQRSVAAYEEALRYRKLDDDPARYAATQNNLGTAYWNLAQYQQPVRCLRQAITAYQEALQYYTRDREPMHYAMIQNNLGTAYWNLAQHAKSAPEEAASNGNGISATELLIQAVKAYGTALFFRTLEASPAAHAATQNNLGTAYWHLAALPDLSPEDHQQCLQRAITAYQAALAAVNYLQTAGTAYAPALTFDPCATESNLGLAYYHLAIDQQIPPTEAQR
jgi:tetratricopeptide (TPR) repeat protein